MTFVLYKASLYPQGRRGRGASKTKDKLFAELSSCFGVDMSENQKEVFDMLIYRYIKKEK